jgi:hypothetical protein
MDFVELQINEMRYIKPVNRSIKIARTLAICDRWVTQREKASMTVGLLSPPVHNLLGPIFNI